MKTTNPTDLRKNLKTNLDYVSSNQAALIVHRTGEEDVVLISLAEYSALLETNYLLSTESNRKHLSKSLSEESKGSTKKIDLDNLWK